MKTYMRKVGDTFYLGIKIIGIGLAISIFYYLSFPESYKEFFGIFYIIYEFLRNLFIH